MKDLTDKERKSLKKFKKKHFNDGHSACSVIFTETGIGRKVEVRCNGCFKIKDISDYESW